MDDTADPSPFEGRMTPDLEALLALADQDPQTSSADQARAKLDDIETIELVKLLCSMGFNLGAPNWHVTEAEIENLADPTARLIDKYFPDIDLGVELQCAICWGLLLLSRRGVSRYADPEVEKDDDAES